MEDAVGEDMAAVFVLGELDFVDGDKVGAHVDGHGFHGADEIARVRRDDALLAGDEGSVGRALGGDDPVIDLAREQAQRQADHAGAVAQHALDGVMRLAGIGGAENGLQGGSHRAQVIGMGGGVKRVRRVGPLSPWGRRAGVSGHGGD